MPILGDLYELLLKQSEPEAQNIATALEIYVNGSLNVFNHRSNIQMDKHRVLCFQLKSLGKALKEIGLLIMQDAVWNRVTANRSKHKTTWFYIDEFHLLLKGQTGSFSVEIWKRFRKWGGIPSGLTQNVKDLLASREIENIFENSDFIYMLNQAQGDRQILAKQWDLPAPAFLCDPFRSRRGAFVLWKCDHPLLWTTSRRTHCCTVCLPQDRMK